MKKYFLPWKDGGRPLEAFLAVVVFYIGNFFMPACLNALAVLDGLTSEQKGLLSDLLVLVLLLTYLFRRGFRLNESGRDLFSQKFMLILVGACSLIWLSDFVAASLGSYIKGATYLTQNQEAQKSAINGAQSVAYLVSANLMGPIFEEILFRGLLFKYVFSKRSWLGLVLVNLLFAFIHTPTDFLSWCYFFVLGVVFTLTYWLSKRIELPILVHILTNLTASLQLLH